MSEAAEGADQLKVMPAGALTGRLLVPGDKSISHRVVMLGAVANGVTEVTGLLMGEDVRATVAAMRSMGVQIEIDEQGDGRILGVGKHGLQSPLEPINLGNSGTAMRLLAGLLVGQSFVSELRGDESLTERPMARVVEPLRAMHARVAARDDRLPPLTLGPNAGNLRALRYRPPVASAQVKSCVLLAGLYANGLTRVEETKPTRDHSERMLRAFGAKVDFGEGWAEVDGVSELTAAPIAVPADISSAAFWLVAASLLPGSELTLRNVGINFRRSGVLRILRAMGADFELLNQRELGAEPVADIQVRAAKLRGIDIAPAWVPDAIDEFPALFVAASCARGVTVLRGAAELRVKESDRIAVMAAGLRELGVEAYEQPDGIIIHGRSIEGGHVDAAGDHRCAMAFAIAGMVSRSGVTIDGCKNIVTSYPNYGSQARSLGVEIQSLAPVLAIDGPSGSGKGTISAGVAAALDWHFLDSGALYRLIAYLAILRGIALDDEPTLADAARSMAVEFNFRHSGPESILLENQAVGEEIRDEAVAEAASRVAALPQVRAALLQLQRDFRRAPGLVADGRDMGTVVFPDATYKVYLTASPEERAQRRYKQLKNKDNSVSLRSLSDEIRARDERDSTRSVAPLKPADDALVIDTTELTIPEVVDRVLSLLR